MSQDISEILQNWAFDPESNVRKIWGDDGQQKLQVRVDQGAFQGILQLNLDGRPDGRRPYGYDFALDYYRNCLEKFRQQHSGNDEGFELDRASCKELFDESARVYGRYIFLLQLQEYRRVVRDTERNMRLFRLVNAYAAAEEDKNNLERWWPYILRINGTSRTMLAVEEEDFDQALTIISQTREEIELLAEVEAEEFFAERERSYTALNELEKEVREKKPLSESERLQRQLQEAIEQEEFERAAQLRDQLLALEGDQQIQSGPPARGAND